MKLPIMIKMMSIFPETDQLVYTLLIQGPFKCYVTQMGVKFSGEPEKCYKGVRFNVISFTRGWVGVQFLGKKHYVTLEWPPTSLLLYGICQNVVTSLNGYAKFHMDLGQIKRRPKSQAITSVQPMYC